MQLKWCTLDHGHLKYFNDKQMVAIPKESIPLASIVCLRKHEGIGKKLYIILNRKFHENFLPSIKVYDVSELVNCNEAFSRIFILYFAFSDLFYFTNFFSDFNFFFHFTQQPMIHTKFLYTRSLYLIWVPTIRNIMKSRWVQPVLLNETNGSIFWCKA